jgi:DNA-binding response OmpR family regulator
MTTTPTAFGGGRSAERCEPVTTSRRPAGEPPGRRNAGEASGWGTGGETPGVHRHLVWPASGSARIDDAAPRRTGRASIVSLNPAGARPLAAQLRGAGLTVVRVVGWGVSGLRQVLAHHETILFDLAGGLDAAEVSRCVRALRHVGPVIAIAPDGADATVALAAGAVNVLHRGQPAPAMVARIRADLRWLRAHRTLRPAVTDPTGHGWFLMHVFARARVPICCHDLRWLLGQPERPLTREALRARLQTAEPALRACGLTIRRDSGWGASTYSIATAPGRPA